MNKIVIECETPRDECDLVPIVDISSNDTYIDVEYTSPDKVIVSASKRAKNLFKKIQSISADDILEKLDKVEKGVDELEESVPNLVLSLFRLRETKADKATTDMLLKFWADLRDEVQKLKRKHYVADTIFPIEQDGQTRTFVLPKEVMKLPKERIITTAQVFSNGVHQLIGKYYDARVSSNKLIITLKQDLYDDVVDDIYVLIGYLKEIK